MNEDELSDKDREVIMDYQWYVMRALWSEVIPSLRQVRMEWDPEKKVVWILFYHDGPITEPISDHYSLEVLLKHKELYNFLLWGSNMFIDSISRQQSSLLTLPEEKQLSILAHLDVGSLLNVAKTCQTLNRLSQDSHLWKLLLITDFPSVYRKIETISHPDFRSLYKTLFREKNIVQKTCNVSTVDLKKETVVYGGDGIDFLTIADDKIIDMAVGGTVRVLNLKGELLRTFVEEYIIWSYENVNGKIWLGLSDGKIKVCDPDSGESYYLQSGTDDYILFLQVYKGKVISGSMNGMVCIWDPQTEKLLDKFQIKSPADEESVSESEEREDDEDDICGADQFFIYEDKIVVRFVDDQICVWDLFKKTPLSLNYPMLGNLSKLIIADNKIVGSPFRSNLLIWDLSSGALIKEINVRCVEKLIVSSGNIFAGLSNGDIEIYDLETFEKKQTLSDHLNTIEILEVYESIVFGGSSTCLKIWDFPSGMLLFSENLEGGLCRLKTHEGKLILSFEDETVQIWDFNPRPQESDVLQMDLV